MRRRRHSHIDCISHYGLVMPLLLIVIVSRAGTLTSEIPAGVDLSQWGCHYCTFEQGYRGEIDAGIGFVSGNSFKYGEYTGLNDKGYFLIGNANARYRDAQADFLDLKVRDLGLDSRNVMLDGGRQGRYRLFIGYHEIPHTITDTVKTPYQGIGTGTLQLPSTWVPAGSTTGMTALAGSLHNESLKTKRERVSVGASFIPARHWQTAVEFHHEVRDGQVASAGSFFFNSAQLILPVDYVTNEAQASVAYLARLWQFKLVYYASYFTNQNSSLRWQNAYSPLVAGAVTGELALPPSNQFHQMLLSGAYQVNPRNHVNADVAIGRMEQNEALLQATTNANLSVTLPESTANARVDTVTANLKYDSHINKDLRINAAYRYNDRNNKTPSLLFDWVTTDSFVSVARRNLPYSFTDTNLHLGGDYRLNQQVKLSAGYKRTNKDRTYQEVDHSQENTVWGKVSLRTPDLVDISVIGAHASRDATGYNLVSDTDPPQNLLLRKYNLADRDRDSGSVNVGINAVNWLQLEFSADISHDRYSNSVVGLTGGRDVNFSADAALMLSSQTSLHLFAGREHITSRQAGSQSLVAADWFAKNDDNIDSLGLGLKRQTMQGKMAIGGDYLLSHSVGSITLDNGGLGGGFPDLKTDLISVKLYMDYRLSENMKLHIAYWYENYHVSDWQQASINTNTIANVVGLAGNWPDYDVRAVMASLRYLF